MCSLELSAADSGVLCDDRGAMRSSLLVLVLTSPLIAQGPVPVEYGRIAWRAGYELARAEARAADRPLLVLFQEVPG